MPKSKKPLAPVRGVSPEHIKALAELLRALLPYVMLVLPFLSPASPTLPKTVPVVVEPASPQ